MNGVMRPDLSPKAQYYEVKKVYQNVGVSAIDMKEGQIEIFNKNYFTPLMDYSIVWSLYQDGVCVKKNQPFAAPFKAIGPREKMVYRLNYDMSQLNPQCEYFVKVQFLLNQDMPWANKGYVQMEEQLPLQAPTKFQSVAEVAKGNKAITKAQEGNLVILSGDGFLAKFDTKTGTIYSLNYDGQQIIKEGEGPKLDCFRAPTDNDNWAAQTWTQLGLYNLQHKVLDWKAIENNGKVMLSFSVESQAPYAGYLKQAGTVGRAADGVYQLVDQKNRPMGANDFKFTTNQIWTVYPDGSIEFQGAISSNKPSADLARLGYVMELPSDLVNYNYYGRGPINNYNDRKVGQNIELHSQKVGDEIILPKPQSMGNREEVRWVSLTDEAGRGAAFIADGVMSVSALPWSQQEITGAAHIYQLPKSTGVHLHLDAKVTGLGGNSCGQGGPLTPDRAKAVDTNFGFIIRPLNIGRAMVGQINETTKVSAAGEKPITIARDRAGMLTLSTPVEGRTIMYTINGAKKAKAYTEPINMRDGGAIKVWYKDNPTLVMSNEFAKIESVPLEVVYASSVETGSGNADHLVDGDLNSLWHTMYSITLAKYPHWVDFDAASVKNMKGFVYTARQDGSNGRVKDYEIFVSQDGKEWGEPVMKGSLKNTGEPQKVMFAKPVKGRYIRFRALSEQNGNDFASGAEFGLIAE